MWNISKVNNNLLTLSRFHTFFWCCHCWLWTSEYWLGLILQILLSLNVLFFLYFLTSHVSLCIIVLFPTTTKSIHKAKPARSSRWSGGWKRSNKLKFTEEEQVDIMICKKSVFWRFKQTFSTNVVLFIACFVAYCYRGNGWSNFVVCTTLL